MPKDGTRGKPHHHPPRALPSPPVGLESASAMFRALGDAARLRLLTRLADAGGEVCVSELAELEKEKLSTVSARLKMLHAVRLVRRRREAKHIFYALSDEHVLHLMQSAIEHAAERQ
jgi:ArsR family transcriptional regulator, lead/cadmium/zinc/bismuth-responsive transcriptional repressor